VEVTRTLARYVSKARTEDIPPAVRREAVRSFVNWVGCAIGGCRHDTVDRVIAALQPFTSDSQATIVGRHERTDVLTAGLLDGISSHVLDYDDTHLKTIIHPAGPVASALFALAEYHPCCGADLLCAFILGVEVECRIGNAVFPEHYDIGWHITGTAGVFGAAAASGKILGLNEQQMTWALGIAGTQSSGFREMFGTMCKSFHPGRAAQNGLLSAFLAQQDFTSSERVLEAPRGFSHVMSTSRNLSEITEGLGQTFEISLNTYKPFACGIVIHPVIDGCIQLRTEYGLSGGEIEHVSLRVAPLVLELTGKRSPQVGLEGKFSVYHSAAVAIIHGAAGEREYSDARVRDSNVIALRNRVDAVAEPSIRNDEAYVEVRLKNGKVLEKHVEHAVGSIQRPMSDKDLEAKFHGLTTDILTAEESERLIGLCWAIESLEDAADLARATVPGSAVASSIRGNRQ
jgi:2-methylcitrate dehydratase PrpD